MSSAKQHAEWLSLTEVSGPFLTLTVLSQSLSFGLDAHNSELYQAVKEAYQEWEESGAAAIHTAWVRFLLTTVLGYPSECIGEAQGIPESAVATLELQNERIRPDLAILDPEDQRKVKLPILIYPRSQKLDSPIKGESWAASPYMRMQALLQNTGLQAGFVTNGAQWSLVHVRKGEPTGFATWQTVLLTEEKILLQAFRGILGVERTLGSPQGESLFDLLDKSAQDQEEVTKELGRQVRQAVEVFINAVDRLDQDSGRKLLAGLEPKEVYNGALTVMMRLIFLLCAEERGLMDDRELYVQNYSVGALNDQLREIASGDEQVLEHRHDAWKQLLATFRLVHGGCNHEDLNLPAYGGSLFDPAKYPFLERCQIDNRVTLHLLDALEFLQIKVPGGGRERRRLSFRALGVEQIGHVYEGLLDHTAVRAEESVVGLTGKETEEDEIALSELEYNSSQIAKFFEKAKIKVSGNPENLLHQQPNVLKVSKLRVACGSDDELYQRVLPFLNLVREDSLEHLQVYPKGSIYVTAGADRKSSGTHYTPVSLTEEVVQYALEPVVYEGPAEGLPRAEWKLKGAQEIVDLKVCDMAMGSGAFLVQACRYLSERLVEAWQESISKVSRPLGFSAEGAFFTHPLPEDHWKKGVGAVATTPIGGLPIADPSQELISENPEERLAQALRIIADRCLYGVDINPMAVEMAKLSLWLTTMRRDRPFTFLDHALKVGDSLIGVTERQLETYSMNPDGQRGDLLLPWVHEAVEEVAGIRAQLARIPSHDEQSVQRKAILLRESEAQLDQAKKAANMLVCDAMFRKDKERLDPHRIEKMIVTPLREMMDQYLEPGAVVESEEVTVTLDLGGLKPFHWHLEFADVFAAGGFDAIIGNPPYLGGREIGRKVGRNYLDFIDNLREGRKGSPDLAVFFLLRAVSLVKAAGLVSFVATDAISDTGNRAVGLHHLESLYTITAARSGIRWSGGASVIVCVFCISKGPWKSKCLHNFEPCDHINALLEPDQRLPEPFTLSLNKGKYSQGFSLMGEGFVLTKSEREYLVLADPRAAQVIKPYVNGDDVNQLADNRPDKFCIDFNDRTLAEAEEFVAVFARVTETVKPFRDKQKGQIHQESFWKFWDQRPRLRRYLEDNDLVLVCASISRSLIFQIVPSRWVFNHKVKVFFTSDMVDLGVLQSRVHEEWARWRCGGMGGGSISYSTSQAYDTFPFPIRLADEIRATASKFSALRASLSRELEVGCSAVHAQMEKVSQLSSQMKELRDVSCILDAVLLKAYGWEDIKLDHGFYGEGRGRRFTISPAARQEVLRRLLKLNHERYEQEVKDGLHDKAQPKGCRGQPSGNGFDAPSGPRRNLFDEQPALGETE